MVYHEIQNWYSSEEFSHLHLLPFNGMRYDDQIIRLIHGGRSLQFSLLLIFITWWKDHEPSLKKPYFAFSLHPRGGKDILVPLDW